MEKHFMKEKPVFPLLLSMAVPMVLSMLVNSLYNIVDSYFVAKISEEAMTALSLVFPVQNLINAAGIGFGIGINAAIAFYLGANKQVKANQAAALGMVSAFLHGMVLTVACIAVMPAFLRLFTADETVLALGLRYSRVAFSFSLMVILGVTFEKIFQAAGHMKVSMFSMICGCAANILLDPVLIFGLGPFPKMGIEGAALATGIGQTLTLAVYVIFYFARPICVQIRRSSFVLDQTLIHRLYAVGIPATLNLALPSILISSLNAVLSVYSEAYIFVLGIYYKLQTFLYLPANGIIQGMRPLIGYNYGAGEYQRVGQLYRLVLCLIGAIMIVGMGLCLVIPGQLIRLFSQSPDIVKAGITALRIISAGFVISTVSVTSSGALEGLGKGIPSFVISLCRYLVILLPTAYLLSRGLGPQGVWHAFWIAEAVTAGISLVIYRRAVNKT